MMPTPIRLRRFFGQPASPADVPEELFDLVLSFFTTEVFESDLNHVMVNKRVLKQLSLVCRRWANLTQPKLFQEIRLRDRQDVHTLLAFVADPKSRVAKHIVRIHISLSVAEFPFQPWVHTVCSVLLSKLPSLEVGVVLDIAGPLPIKKRLRGIHQFLPTYFPLSSARITEIKLSLIHFTSFKDLVHLLREMPWVQTVHCGQVTWDCSSDDESMPVATSYLSRCKYLDDIVTKYTMTKCTNNGAAAWLSWLLAPTFSSRLQQDHAEALCRIASASIANVDVDKYPDFQVHCDRHGDSFAFWAECNAAKYTTLTPRISVFLELQMPGQLRRVRAIVLEFDDEPESISNFIKHGDWITIDKQIMDLPALETVLFTFESCHDIPVFHKEVLMASMSRLHHAPALKYAFRTSKGLQAPAACADDAVNEIAPAVKDWKELL